MNLKNLQKKLGHSLRKREIPNLAKKCYKYFGSFNKAKQLAGLIIVNVRRISFQKHAFDLDKDLAFITAFLTADGHIYKDKKGFYFCSNNLSLLKGIEIKLKNKFGLTGLYRKGTGYGNSYKLLFFNKPITLFLIKQEVPLGDKMITSFNIPNWIKENREFSREYLRTLFYCGGSKYKQSKNTETIKINFNKSEKLLDNAIIFMNSIKDLLAKFNIKTTKIWISKSNLRNKDNLRTKQISFKIKANSFNRFINEIGWLK